MPRPCSIVRLTERFDHWSRRSAPHPPLVRRIPALAELRIRLGGAWGGELDPHRSVRLTRQVDRHLHTWLRALDPTAGAVGRVNLNAGVGGGGQRGIERTIERRL